MHSDGTFLVHACKPGSFRALRAFRDGWLSCLYCGGNTRAGRRPVSSQSYTIVLFAPKRAILSQSLRHDQVSISGNCHFCCVLPLAGVEKVLGWGPGALP
eukprot:1372206-Prymnesium_polylepis.1